MPTICPGCNATTPERTGECMACGASLEASDAEDTASAPEGMPASTLPESETTGRRRSGGRGGRAVTPALDKPRPEIVIGDSLSFAVSRVAVTKGRDSKIEFSGMFSVERYNAIREYAVNEGVACEFIDESGTRLRAEIPHPRPPEIKTVGYPDGAEYTFVFDPAPGTELDIECVSPEA